MSTVVVSVGRESPYDPHRIELNPGQFESPYSEALSTGRIAIVVGTPLTDDSNNS